MWSSLRNICSRQMVPVVFLLGAVSSAHALQLSALFSDRAVLQRESPIPIWGSASAGEEIAITLNGRTTRVTTRVDGHWSARLPALQAGGPYDLAVAGQTETRILKDILIGDVWLCSGQSNMEFPLAQDQDGPQAIAGADDNRLRVFRAKGTSSDSAMVGLSGSWTVSSPDVAGTFSAVAAYFGRHLRSALDVPVGLVVAARGGSSAEAWISGSRLLHDPGLEAVRLALSGPEWSALQGMPLPGPSDSTQVAQALSSRPAGMGPLIGVWSTGIETPTGTYLVATRFSHEGDTLRILHAHREFGLVEGENLRGSDNMLAWTALFRPISLYPVQLLVRITEGSFGGLLRNREMEIPVNGRRVPDSLAVQAWLEMEKESLLDPDHVPGVLYTSLIAPMSPYGIRGVVWYQGESNTAPSKAPAYRELLRNLIENWRECLQTPDLPFLFVQLPNFGERRSDPNAPATWALVREAQLQTLSVSNTGMAVTIDLGDSDTIHPPRKREVGRRLALQALRNVYGGDLVASGPIFRSAAFEGGAAAIQFDHAEGGLSTSDGNRVRSLVVAGEDRRWHRARATIDGARLVVQSDEVPAPVAVRYGWANNPDANLQNSSGLPASPFRTDDW